MLIPLFRKMSAIAVAILLTHSEKNENTLKGHGIAIAKFQEIP
jgi:hypothetical protein